MNSSSSNCSLAKKKWRYREAVGAPFFGLTLYYREYFAFSYTIGDALNTLEVEELANCTICSLLK